MDISNIIKLAADPQNTELFLQVYYKLGTYLRKQDAHKSADISRKQKLSVWEAALQYGDLDGYVRGSISAIQTHIQHLPGAPAGRAIYRIVQYMGYQDYLTRSEIKDNKLDTLRMLAAMEESPIRLVERLGELQQIIKEKPQDYSCLFVLFTIHASKGLEYDAVYLLDVIDGILPAQVLQNSKSASKEELETYEEERRLFYVGITRAKNQLNVFTMKPQSSDFCDELFGRKVPKKPMEIPKRATAVNQLKVKREQPKTISDVAYQYFLDQLGGGMVVEHKKFGEGVIAEMEKGKIWITFKEGTKSFKARALAGSGMLKLH